MSADSADGSDQHHQPTVILAVLTVTAPATTIVQFLTGSHICLGFLRKGSTGDASAIPFVAGFVNCAVWLR